MVRTTWLRMTSDSDLHPVEQSLLPEGSTNLLEIFRQLTPQQVRLIDLFKAGTLGVPARQDSVGPAVSRKDRDAPTVANRSELSPEKAHQFLPLVVDYAKGLTQERIARKHGIHAQTLRKGLRKAGVDTRGHLNALSDEKQRSARRVISDGTSLRSTARRFGVAHTTLHRALQQSDA